MTDRQVGTGEVGFKDRRFGLIGWGIFQLLLGGLCLLLMLLMGLVAGIGAAVGKSNGGAPEMNASMMVPAILVYGALAAWGITMGVGSIRCRRWARAVIVAASWLTLIGGGMGLLFMVFLMPDLYGPMVKNGQMPEMVARIARIVTLGFMAVFYVILPACLLLFYSSRDCRATCEARDPWPRWTDGLPVPVLALTLLFWMWAGSILFMGSYNWALPFFGVILAGATGAGVVVVVSACCAGVAWGLARLRIEAWWGALILSLAWMVSSALTFSRVPFIELYRKMNFTAQQLDMMEQMQMPGPVPMTAMMVAGFLVMLGALVYGRRYFTRAD